MQRFLASMLLVAALAACDRSPSADKKNLADQAPPAATGAVSAEAKPAVDPQLARDKELAAASGLLWRQPRG